MFKRNGDKTVHNVEESWIPHEPDTHSSNASQKGWRRKGNMCLSVPEDSARISLSVCLFAHIFNVRNNKFLV
jgi:hypothetical protein